MIDYLNKAIVEMQSQDQGSITRIRQHRAFHFFPNDIKHRWAGGFVVI